MPTEKATSHLAHEFAELDQLYAAQPVMTRLFMDRQAAAILSAMQARKDRIAYRLPDQIVLEGGEILNIPESARGRGFRQKRHASSRTEARAALLQHMGTLENGLHAGLAVCARLYRYALARVIVHQLLPDGRSVHYLPENDDDIPSIPAAYAPASALLAATDAITVTENGSPTGEHLQVPYVAEARRFYLPQWVALDGEDRLLTRTLAEADAIVASLENAVHLLEDAAVICPCIVRDDAYQHKRAGLFGQLVNQGRALARHHNREIIARIRGRVAAGTLNRGFSLSLPYFDDDDLSMHRYEIEVIPRGRILFVPAFVVLATRRAQDQIHDDYRFNHSTRMHLLAQLRNIEEAFKKHPSPQEIG